MNLSQLFSKVIYLFPKLKKVQCEPKNNYFPLPLVPNLSRVAYSRTQSPCNWWSVKKRTDPEQLSFSGNWSNDWKSENLKLHFTSWLCFLVARKINFYSMDLRDYITSKFPAIGFRWQQNFDSIVIERTSHSSMECIVWFKYITLLVNAAKTAMEVWRVMAIPVFK